MILMEKNLPDDEFKQESNHETDKVEGFADDTMGKILLELSSLTALKQILIDYGQFSGLKGNVEKTVLLQIYPCGMSGSFLDVGRKLVFLRIKTCRRLCLAKTRIVR
jgi:hypothetical protein